MYDNSRKQARAAKKAAKKLNESAKTPPTRLYGKPALKQVSPTRKAGYATVAKKYPKYKGHVPKAAGSSKQAKRTRK